MACLRSGGFLMLKKKPVRSNLVPLLVALQSIQRCENCDLRDRHPRLNGRFWQYYQVRNTRRAARVLGLDRFKPGGFMTTGMKETRTAWLCANYVA